MSSVEFLGRHYSSPLWAASGTFGWGLEAVDGGYFPKVGLGAVLTKGVSPLEMLGAPQARIVEVGHGVGLINAIGLQNPGLKKFLSHYVNRYDQGDVPVPIWVNVFGSSLTDYVHVIRELRAHAQKNNSAWLAGFELNVSCPNVDKGGAEFGSSTELLGELVKNCVAASGPIPLIVKLSPHPYHAVDLALAAEANGAAALSLSNTLPAGLPVVQAAGGTAAKTSAWLLGRKFGGLSGPALKAVSLRLTDLVANRVKIPLCGIGGIMNAFDAKEYFAAGAQVVQVGTAHFANPWICEEIFSELSQ